MPKSNIKFQNVAKKKATNERKIATIVTFSTKLHTILQRFWPFKSVSDPLPPIAFTAVRNGDSSHKINYESNRTHAM